MSDKIVKLSGEQLDRLILLEKRRLQLARQQARQLGSTEKQISTITERATEGLKTMAVGGLIELDGAQYRLAGADEDSVTLRRVTGRIGSAD